MVKQEILFTACGMLIDTIVLFFYFNCHSIKQNRRHLLVISYLLYFISNFILGSINIPFWIRTGCNILMIITIGFFFYKDVSNYEIGKAAIIFILLLGIAELVVIPIGFFLTGRYDADIFNDPSRPYLWIISMGLSRMIALLLFNIYRKIQKRDYEKLDGQEIWILYLPLAVSFTSFLVITKTVLDINNFENEDLIFLLIAIAMTLTVYTLIHMIFFERYVQYRDKNQELSMLRQKNNLQFEYYRNQKETIENIRIMYHDLKNHLLVSSYNTDYLEKSKNTIKQFENILDTGSEILDILLWEKYNESNRLGIELESVVEKIDLNFIEDMDICSIVGNVLDNAIEASSEVDRNLLPEICLRIGKINNFVIIKVENDCIGNSRKKGKDNIFKTTKNESNMHGIGLHSVKRAVKKYDGNCEFECIGDKFIVEILIPIPINQ